MSGIKNYVRRKLSIKVSLWVVFFAAIIFNVALGFLFYQAREAVREEAISKATQILKHVDTCREYPEPCGGGK